MLKETKGVCLTQPDKNHRNWKAELLVQFSVCRTQANQPLQYAVPSTLLRLWRKYSVYWEKKIRSCHQHAMWKVPMMFRCLFLTSRCTLLRNSPTWVRLTLIPCLWHVQKPLRISADKFYFSARCPCTCIRNGIAIILVTHTTSKIKILILQHDSALHFSSSNFLMFFFQLKKK